jgi:K+-transporting ATPase ATPase C chain
VTALVDLARQSVAGLRLLLALTVLTGVLYPLGVLLAGRAVPDRADGQLLRDGATVVGSRLLGQTFDGPGWFASRPSVAGAGYDPLASGASNLGPGNADLLATVEARRAAVAAREGVDPAAVPPDAVTASGSGLDPHISPAYARLQVPRVAAERDLPVEQVRALVEQHVEGAALGFVGAPTVNVVELNLAVAAAAAAQRPGSG